MSEKIKIKIDGIEVLVKRDQKILEAATENGIYIPKLCSFDGIKPKGSCRMCTVKVNGRPMTACTTPVVEGMEIENNTDSINEIRKSIIEALFVEGNHFCPACEKSGNCELQALAYRYLMLSPRFPYSFPEKGIDAKHPKLIIDSNRCILCKRCVRNLKNEDGNSYFAVNHRGVHSRIVLDHELSKDISDEMAQKAMDTCPVGVIIRKEIGFIEPIGTRKYDKMPIGSEIENILNEGGNNNE